jgi:hypothetical protein
MFMIFFRLVNNEKCKCALFYGLRILGSAVRSRSASYRIFSNLIRTPFLPPCIVRTARTPALSFGQTPALDRESNPHSILICICIFSPLQLENGCGLDSRIYGLINSISKA